MKKDAQRTVGQARAKPPKESWIEQSASFIGFFIYLLILKSFFLPLFIIPTGSMAETLYGAHALHTCPNCATEYAVGWQEPPPDRRVGAYHPTIQCPNCRWIQYFGPPAQSRAPLDAPLAKPLNASAGDRIFVHGWTYEPPFNGLPGLGPQRWDVVVFKVPTDGQTNYIKRLIGLPGETIEIIDGDIFVNGRLERKTADAQRSLWFRYYDHDHVPRAPALHAMAAPANRGPGYHPRWIALDPTGGWTGVETREPRFDGLERSHADIRFVTEPEPATTEPGLVQDVYGYNEPWAPSIYNTVTDVRLSAQLAAVELAPDGYVELSTTKGPHRFSARLGAGGRLELLHAGGPGAAESWGAVAVAPHAPARLALAHIDGVVSVEWDGHEVLSSRDRYIVTPDDARTHASDQRPPVLQFGAQHARVQLRHLLIERDVYYTSNRRAEQVMRYGVQGNPIELGPESYFVLGDNSPNSQDARYSFARDPSDRNQAVGPHLRERQYQLGTVPADQMIGRAFFVYWPGFLPVTPWGGINFLPDAGRIRWIH